MATSPPTPTHLTLPNAKKRPPTGPPSQSVPTPTSSQAAKRPKHQHPLRQTSFPAIETQTGLYASSATHSETGSISASLISGVSSTTGGKRSRGRPKKRKNQPYDIQTGRGGDDDEGTSTILDGVDNTHTNSRGRGGGTKSIISGTGPNAADEAADEDDDAPLADPNSDESRRLQAEIAKEKENIATLQEALTPEQMQRYISYTRTKLKMATLKRIINQTVSQSVTSNPLQAVQWVGKVFVGELVEIARAVQGEWAVGWEKAREEEKERREEHKKQQQQQREKEEEKENDGDDSAINARSATTITTTPTTPAVVAPPPTVKPTEDLYADANPHRGGLLPDHIREAVRRYKAAGEGGGVGFGGYSFGNLAVKGEAVPRLGMGGAGGRRLFR